MCIAGIAVSRWRSWLLRSGARWKRRSARRRATPAAGASRRARSAACASTSTRRRQSPLPRSNPPLNCSSPTDFGRKKRDYVNLFLCRPPRTCLALQLPLFVLSLSFSAHNYCTRDAFCYLPPTAVWAKNPWLIIKTNYKSRRGARSSGAHPSLHFFLFSVQNERLVSCCAVFIWILYYIFNECKTLGYRQVIKLL